MYDAIIAGAGPAGLSAAETLARGGHSTLVLEQNHEIGSPIRTSGGSFIDEMDGLGIPGHLYHPISRVRFLSSNNSAIFDFPKPAMCVLDVRGTFQFLAGRAIAAGAQIRLAAAVTAPLVENSRAGRRAYANRNAAQPRGDRCDGLPVGVDEAGWARSGFSTLRGGC